MSVESVKTAVICEMPCRESERVSTSPGNAGQRRLERKGDLALDLLRPERGRDAGHHHLTVGDVGHGVDRQPDELAQAEAEQHQRRAAATAQR